MEVTKIVQSTAVRTFAGVQQPWVYLPRLIDVIANEYGFVDFPKTIEQISTPSSLTFNYGNLRNEAVITQLVVYNDGAFVQGAVHSDLLDGFIDDLLALLTKNFSTVTEGVQTRSYYRSQLECVATEGLSKWLSQIDPIVASLKSGVERYGVGVDRYEAGGFTIVGEGPDEIKPGKFVFERRIGEPLASNIFYSEAPLSTDQHTALLNELEALF